MKSKTLVGTSGFSYRHWKEVFYPRDISQKQWFEYYLKYFDTVELNTTFYHLPKEKTVLNWKKEASEDFVFSLKASRYISHIKRLKDSRQPLNKFYKSIHPLGKKSGPVLFQLPARAKKNIERLKTFLKNLRLFPGRKVVELRHPSWWDDEVFNLLEEERVCFCWFSMPGENPPEICTSDFLYIRMHGKKELYKSPYSEKKLEKLAKKIYKVDVNKAYIYFNNDYNGNAVRNALKLKEVLN
ncbi:MAG: DUF72 domain-containing protein, partial [Elusimicrobiota bacterium]